MFRALLLVVGIAIFCPRKGSSEEQSKEETLKVNVEIAKKQEIFDILQYPVHTLSKEESEVFSPIKGYVDKINVRMGQEVKKNQILMVLKHTSAEFSYKPVLVKSFVNGRIAKIDRKMGERVQPGARLMHVINSKNIAFEFEVPQTEIQHIEKGVLGSLTFLSLDEIFPVVVQGISPMISQSLGTSTAVMEMDKTKITTKQKEISRLRLRPGMLGKAKFQINHRKSISVPQAALAFEKKGYILYFVKEGKIQKRPVQVGADIPGQRKEILSGLIEGESVVTSRGQYLREGDKVEITKDQGSQ